jgi:hypothetical protein
MRNIHYILNILLCLILGFSSCDNRTNNLSMNVNKSDGIKTRIISEDNLCLVEYIKTAKLLYSNLNKIKKDLQKNCINYEFTEDMNFEKNQLNIIRNMIINSKIDTSNILFLKYSINDGSNYGCTGYSKQVVPTFGWQPFYSINTDSIFYQFVLFDSYIDGKESAGTRLAISVFPIPFVKSVDDIGNYFTCEGQCDFSFTIFFNELPDCLCEWNKNHPQKPITNTGWMLNGDVMRLNDCLFNDSLLYKKNYK